VLPLDNVALIVLVIEDPAFTERSPEFEIA
jgi:hypothetical protein